MATNQNNIQINSFVKGMNTDTSVQVLQEGEYTMAENLRVFPLSSTGNEFGKLKSIEGVTKKIECELIPNSYKILCADTIRDYGFVIVESTVEGEQYKWYVYKFKYVDGQFTDFSLLFQNENTYDRLGGSDGVDKLSAVCRFEDDDNVKVYVADGFHSIMVFNLAKDEQYSSIDDVISYKNFNLNPLIFCNITSGNLKSGLVQYSYSLYEDKGIQTEASVPTKLIPIVYSKSDWTDGKQIYSGDQDKILGAGVRMKVPISDDETYKNFKIKVYRIFYTENGQQPTIETIIDTNVSGLQYFVDSGQSALETLTLEEYNSIAGIHIIPKVLESKFDYLFAANIKDQQTFVDEYTEDFDARSYSQEPNRTFGFAFYDVSTKYKITNDYDNLLDCYTQANTLDESLIDPIFDKISVDDDCFNIYNDMSQEYTDFTEVTSTTYGVGPYCRYNARDKNNIVYGGIGKYVDWKFIVTELDADMYPTTIGTPQVSGTGYDPKPISTGGDVISIDNTHNIDSNIQIKYIKSDGTLYSESENKTIDLSKYYESGSSTGLNYSNPVVSYALKSLKRDELYRFGIILYNKKGDHSSVKWIADIRTPKSSFKGCEAFLSQGSNSTQRALGTASSLSVRPLGIEFIVNIDKYNNKLQEKAAQGLIQNWSDDLLIDKYEIVRCNRTEMDNCTLSQGVISRPVKKIFNERAWLSNQTQYPYTPTGWLTTANIWHGAEFYAYNTSNANAEADYEECSNYENHTLYQFVSPEVLYQKDSIEQLMQNRITNIQPITYLFNQSDGYSPDNFRTPAQYLQMGSDPGEGQIETDNGTAVFGWSSDRNRVYMQTGVHNLSLPMPPIYSENEICIGDENEDNKINGISLMSIFYTRNTIVSSFYSLYPKDHQFVGTPDEFTTKIQFYEPGSMDEGPSTQTFGRWPAEIARKLHAYSKLYHQSVNLYTRDYSNLYNNRYDEIIGSKTSYYSTNLRKSSYSYKINDFKIAKDIAWNELYEDTKTDNNTTTNFKYTDSITNVGSESFCNCVCFGSIDDQDYLSDDEEGILNSNGVYLAQNSYSDTLVGPGGRTALISIEDDNIFYKTIAAYIAGVGTGYKLHDLEYRSAETDYSYTEHSETQSYVDPNGDGNTDTYRFDTIFGNYIYRNSIAGTYLCNIRQNVVPYGGYDKTSRSLNSYYSYGDIYNGNENAEVFDGDCIIFPMEYVSMHKYYYPRIKSPVTLSIIYAIPVETNINIAYTYGYEFSRNATGFDVTSLQVEPADVSGYLTQTLPLYSYNTAYSSNPYAKIYQSESDEDVLNNTDYRCYYSNPKTADEKIDSWCKFMSINYLDADSRYGEITNMVSFKDKLLFWQDKATGLFSVNERSQIVDNSNQQLILGQGGVLSRYDYIDQISGMSKEKYCDAQSMSTLYWYDDKNKELKLYGGDGYTNMNDTYHTDNYMQNNASSYNPIMFYDQKYLELVSKVANDDSLTYNEKYGMFTSVYKVPFDEHVQFSNDHFLLKQNDNKLNIYKWNELTGDRAVDTQGNVLQTYVQFVINQDPLTTKVFDNQEIVTTEMYGYDSYDKSYFNTNHQYTWETDLNYAETDDLQYTDREGNFRFAIPRAVDDSGEEVAYGNRVRGKYMICSITDKQNKYDTSISYVITKFRKSWT